MVNTSPYAAIVWFIETGFGAMDASRSTLFKFPTFGVGSSSWYLNPPNQLTIGTPLLNMSGVSDVGWLNSTTPFSLMNVIHLGTSSSPMNFSSSAEFALVPDSASSLALLGPLVLGLIILPKRWRLTVVNRP